MLTRGRVLQVIDTYRKAWETQDPDLILTCFTPGAVYLERVLEPPVIIGHEGIRAYWEEKVVRRQAHITCELVRLHMSTDGKTAIAEWAAWFDDLEKDERKHMLEIAVLEFEDGLISQLREYWASEVAASAV